MNDFGDHGLFDDDGGADRLRRRAAEEAAVNNNNKNKNNNNNNLENEMGTNGVVRLRKEDEDELSDIVNLSPSRVRPRVGLGSIITLDHQLKGYEFLSFDAVNVPPPLPEPKTIEEEKEEEEGSEAREEIKVNIKTLAPVLLECQQPPVEESEAKMALLEHLREEHCCWGTRAAKNLVVKETQPFSAFHYEIQTFSEKRETAWTYSALNRSNTLDPEDYDPVGMGMAGGQTPPLPWDIEAHPTHLFRDEFRLVPVPRTSTVKTCHKCRGSGGTTCRDCNGKGWYRCLHCHGDGYLGGGGSEFKERCFYCHHSKHGHGHQDCGKCGTKGTVSCPVCEGGGQIRCFIQLSITWKVHTSEFILNPLDERLLSDEMIREVSGQVALEEEEEFIAPLSNVDVQELKEASKNLYNRHVNKLVDQKILRQRHQVRVVPISKLSYEWKEKNYDFFLYGYERKVTIKQYPNKCCFGCCVIC